MAKPPLKLVAAPAADPAGAPSNLGRTGKELWSTILAEYDIADAGGRELLAQACAAADRAAACAAHIERDGEIIKSKSGPREHPLLKAEIASRSFVVRTLHRLGLDVEAVKPVGRPPGAW